MDKSRNNNDSTEAIFDSATVSARIAITATPETAREALNVLGFNAPIPPTVELRLITLEISIEKE